MSIDTQATIFDILNVFLSGGPKQTPKPDETHRYYLCEESTDKKRRCMRAKYNEVISLQDGQQRMWVKKGCPEFNDQMVLSWKAKKQVSLVSKLSDEHPSPRQ